MLAACGQAAARLGMGSGDVKGPPAVVAGGPWMRRRWCWRSGQAASDEAPCWPSPSVGRGWRRRCARLAGRPGRVVCQSAGSVRSGSGRSVAGVGDVVGEGLLDGRELVADAGEERQVGSGCPAGAGAVPVGAPGVLALAFGHRLLVGGDDRAEHQQRQPARRGGVARLQPAGPRRGPVISLNSSRPGAAARPERSGSGMVSSCRATNGAASRGAVRRANSSLASHRFRTSPAAFHALLPSMTSRRSGSGGPSAGGSGCAPGAAAPRPVAAAGDVPEEAHGRRGRARPGWCSSAPGAAGSRTGRTPRGPGSQRASRG